ncbi:MAG: arsenosugar biosynthesis radical SAM protein ArsS [Fibrobacteres bacterium]|nr:arsenosugar biosynthesis radical SAM protein ArsS [Fibrobacterota bacterium]
MNTTRQREILADWDGMPFAERTRSLSSRADVPRTLQINLGAKCNQACLHCHVEASPSRQESMSAEVARECMALLERCPDLETVDLTGGAPELHEQFRFLVERSRALGRKVIDRCNLTVISEPGCDWIPDFLAKHQVEVISSLPDLAKAKVDHQRGHGVYDKSILGLRALVAKGYGDTLPLQLVHNPEGPTLPVSQACLEKEFRENLSQLGIQFTTLFTLTNMPVGRFLSHLDNTGKLGCYLKTLSDAFNPCAFAKVMCKSQVSISWDGKLYDCDFNQMLDLPAKLGADLATVGSKELADRSLALGNHCYGCTAGAGSSCTGSLVSTKTACTLPG